MSQFWRKFASFVLRQRIPILLVILALTGLMWMVRGTKISQTLSPVIPSDHPDMIAFKGFKAMFGEDGTTLAIGLEGDVFSLNFFQNLYALTQELQQQEGVTNVLSLTNLVLLERNDSTESFSAKKLVPAMPTTQAAVDSIHAQFQNEPFYKDLILDKKGKTTLVAVSLDTALMNTARKVELVGNVERVTNSYSKKMGLTPHFAGLPILRANVHRTVSKELVLFLGIALVIMAITLLIFFRSFTTMIFPILVVGVIIIWSVGIIGLLGYEIGLITGIIPALVTVIGIPNSMYLITKYHIEYLRTRNKMKSLSLVIQKIGIATVMTNATTAAGLVTVAFTNIKPLQEFGIVASLSIVVAFFISVLLIPIVFSFLPPPTPQQTRHIQSKSLDFVIRGIDHIVKTQRKAIFALGLFLVIFSIVGISRIKSLAYLADDIPQNSTVSKDLRFIEKRFSGVLPFEILIDTKKKRGALAYKNIRKVNEFQERLSANPELSRSISVVNFVDFARQALFGGDSSAYIFPTRNEYNFIQLYAKNSDTEGGMSFAKKLTDSTSQVIRVTTAVQDIGSQRMEELVGIIRTDLDAIFDTADFKTVITGTTPIFVTSTKFLVNNLIQSLILAFLLIGGLMALLFRNIRMIFIAILPNTLPLMMVAGIMGFTDIHLKPSTVLVFGIAFGIAVDTTIHFLIRYRLAKQLGDTTQGAISNSFRDTGVGILYTSMVLFIGFVSFTASQFGGTKSLGLLMSMTLLIAMFVNLFLLPSLLLWLDKDKVQVE